MAAVRARMARLLVALACLLFLPAGTVRMATYDVGLGRSGPGLLLHELRREPKPDVAAALAVIRETRPDVLLLNGFDHDFAGVALDAFRDLLREEPGGIDYPHRFLAAVNAGVPSGRDLDGDGRVMGFGDALGWGRFPGNGGMAILSRLPLETETARTFRTLPWEGADLPLASQSVWDVAVVLPDGRRTRLLAANPTPPLFRPMNRDRNDAEIGFLADYLDGAVVTDDQGQRSALEPGPVVVLGNLNADPMDGEGIGAGLRRLLAHRRIIDPAPTSEGGQATGGAGGPPGQDTAFRAADPERGRGPLTLRLDYVLPSRDLELAAAGVAWPPPGTEFGDLVAGGPMHRLVWIDIRLAEDQSMISSGSTPQSRDRSIQP